MAENYWYSSLSSDEIEAILLNSVRGDVAQEKSTSWMAQARANIGAGAENTGFVILGYYDTVEELQESLQIPPKAGDAYGIGMTPPYNIYVWDASNNLWVDNGPLNIGEFIDDSEISPVLTWSSEKINEELSQIDLSVLIDDSDVETDTTWSSNKISSELSGKATPADVAALVDDSTTSASTTWSSQKIAAEIEKCKWQLLWTNPNPSSSFAPQTVSVDLTLYRHIAFSFQHSTSDLGIYTVIAPVVFTEDQSAPRSFTLMAMQGFPSSGAMGAVRRRGAFTTSGIVFDSGTNKNGTSAPSDDNSKVIPLAIYGIV